MLPPLFQEGHLAFAVQEVPQELTLRQMHTYGHHGPWPLSCGLLLRRRTQEDAGQGCCFDSGRGKAGLKTLLGAAGKGTPRDALPLRPNRDIPRGGGVPTRGPWESTAEGPPADGFQRGAGPQKIRSRHHRDASASHRNTKAMGGNSPRPVPRTRPNALSELNSTKGNSGSEADRGDCT